MKISQQDYSLIIRRKEINKIVKKLSFWEGDFSRQKK